VLKLPRGTTMDDRARVQLLASALVLFSQGIAYVHAGQELLRSKSLDRNSFDSGDWFNSYDPTGARHGFGRGLPPRNDNAASWPLQRERLVDTALVPSPAAVRFTRAAFLDLLRIRASSTLFRLRTAGEVRTRLRFANVGRAQQPTVVAAHLDGRGLAGANFADLLYAVNADTVAHEVTVPWLAGAPLQLHPVLGAPTAADARVHSARWDRARGVLTVPPRTAVVWGRR
jgi:pullulanase/glycogen debranching enzyme